MPAFTRALAVAGLTCSVLVLAACGDGSGGTSDRSSERTTTTRRTTTTNLTTTTEAAQADAATAAASAAKVFELDDLPEGWTVATEAPPYETKGLAIDECSNPADGPLAALPRRAWPANRHRYIAAHAFQKSEMDLEVRRADACRR